MALTFRVTKVERSDGSTPVNEVVGSKVGLSVGRDDVGCNVLGRNVGLLVVGRGVGF